MSQREAPDLSVRIGRMALNNPVITASGTFGFGKEFEDLVDLSQLGAIIPKGISLRPMPGNRPPRLFETDCGLINSIGLQNPGFDAFVKHHLPYLLSLKTPIIVNFFGNTVEEYVELARRFDEIPGLSGLEMNVSCPNVSCGGISFASDAKMTYELVREVRKATSLTLLVKLSPHVTDMGTWARCCEEAGADAVSLVNTFRALAVNIRTRRPELGNLFGGLSGPAIRPVALRMVWEASQAVQIPVVGLGGIMNAEHAIAFLLVGATAVEIGTANLVNPRSGIEIVQGIRDYLEQNGIPSVRQLTGLFLKESG